jgi:signal transduction histidine kinase
VTVGHSRLPLPAVAALGAFQVGASFLAGRGQPERADLDVWAVLLLLTGPASFLLGRRWPFVPVIVAATAASVFIGLGYPFGPIFASVGISMFLAIQAGRRREVLAFAPLAVAGLALATELDERGDGFRWPHMLIAAGWMIAILAVSEIVRAQREQRAERRRADEAARERRLADERMRLAQELHDVLAHNISLINVQASTALHLLDQQPERAAEALANVKRASADALGELRVALDVLRDGDSPRAPAPKLAELEALVEGVRAGGLAVTLIAEGVPAGLASTVELAAYRIVQEALTNVTRHSSAQAVTVRVAGEGDALTVEIVDDGHAAHVPATSNGRGLVGMRERAASLGGTFEAGPTPNGGFRVAARLPVSGR